MDRFNPRHYMFLMFAVGIVSLKTYPTVVLRDGGRDSWIAVSIGCVILTLLFAFSLSTFKQVPRKSMVELYEGALGKPVGRVFLLLFCIAVFIVLIESACVQSDSMHTNMLVETPNWYFLLFFIVPSLYVVRKNIVAVVTISIVGIILITIAGINLAVLTGKQKNFALLLPIMGDGVTMGFILAIIKTVGMLGFVGMTFPYLYKINDDRVPLVKYGLLGLLFIIQMQIVSTTGILSTFSLDRAASYYYPKLVQTHLVSYFQILEFGELYVMLQTLGGWLLKYLVGFHAILQILRAYDVKGKPVNIIIYVVSAFVFGGALFATQTTERLFSLLAYMPWISLANFVIIPLAVCIVYRVRMRAKKPLPTASIPQGSGA